MGNDQSHSTVWKQPAVADIALHAGANKDLYGRCPQTIQQAKLAAQLSKKAMLKVQKRVLVEYPYLSNVQESMVVCDNRQPDCPIVYVNDEFEKLTLYPKEEIIGRNCRFLQGRYTNKDTVKKIRFAVDNGLPLDIELFNYRKDGTGFFNNFLLLPVHKSKGSKVVTHFIAIQKDISVVKRDTNAQVWAPPECAMWLEYLNMGRYADLLVQNDIDGKTLLTLNNEDMQDLGIDDGKDRDELLRYLTRLQRKPEAAWQMLDRNISCSTEDASLYAGAVDEVCLTSPQNEKLWRKDGEKERSKMVAVKCYFKDEIVIFRGEAIKFSQINKLIENTWHLPMRIKYSTTNETKLTIKNSAEWKKAVKEGGGYVALHLSKRLRDIPESVTKTLDLLGVLVALVDWEGTLLFVNKASKALLDRGRDNLLHLPHIEVFPGLELRIPEEGEWRQIEAQGKKKRKVGLSASISLFDDTTYLIQAVPLPS